MPAAIPAGAGPGVSGKIGFPRVHRRSGGPCAWLYMEGPRRTFAGDPGDVADLARGCATGVRANGCTWTRGPRGPRLAFDGTGLVDVVDPRGILAFTGPFSISCRFRRDSNAATGILISKGYDGNNVPYRMYVDTSGHLNFDSYNGSPHGVSSPGPISLGVEYHALGTFDGASWNLYLDGYRVVRSIDATPPPLSDVGVEIGAIYLIATGPADYWVGAIDDVRFFNYALGPAEVADEAADPDRRLRPASRSPILAAVAAGGGGTPPAAYAHWRNPRPGVLGTGVF